jgi:DNA polymerase II small subunit
MKSDVEAIYKSGIRLTPEAYEFLEHAAVEQSILEKIIGCGSPIVTREMVESFISTDEKIPVQATVARAAGFRPAAKEYEAKFRVIDRSDVSGKSNCTGKLEDFVAHFRNRFERISKILRTRVSPNPLATTKRLKTSIDSKVRLIAMVNDRRITKKGNLLLDVEDEEGSAKVVIGKETEAFKAAQRMLLDDIVALDGKSIGELFICDGVTWPELPFAREQKATEKDVAIAYLSDLHFGSKKFLDKEFARFVSWLNGSEGRADLAGKVKYLVVCGDVVDGVGIYPDQEKELAVKDIYKQYEMFDKALLDIPDYISVIVTPGNHDAVRRAEPQPMIPYDMLKSDVIRAGNPATVEIEGLRHLLYHGTSLDSIIAGITGLSYSRPEEAMLEVLKRRHLSPIYGDNLIVPEGTDYLVIDEEPDVVHMGHVHKNGYMLYRGSLLVNSGTFQDRTDFQVRMGHMPTPGVVPVLETRTGKLSHISFMGNEGA